MNGKINKNNDMKLEHIIGGLFVIILTSCSDEKIVNNTVSCILKEEVRITATINSQKENSRVVFERDGSVTHVKWEIDDVITLFTEEQSNLHYKIIGDVENADIPSALVSTTNDVLRNVEGQSVYACYPATNGTISSVTLPVTDVLDYNGKDVTGEGDDLVQNKYCPFLYGSGIIQNGELALKFNHIFAYLKLTISEDDLPFNMANKQIDAVSITSSSKENPLGINSGSYNLVTGELQITKSTNTVLVKKTHDLSTGELTFYVPILPQTYGTYFYISLLRYEEMGKNTLFTTKKKMPTAIKVDEEGNYMEYVELDFEAGNVYDLSPIESMNGGVEVEVSNITQNSASIVAKPTDNYAIIQSTMFYFEHPYSCYSNDFVDYVYTADESFSLVLSDLKPDSTYVVYPLWQEFTAEAGNIDYFTRLIFRTNPLVYACPEEVDLGLSVMWASHNIGTDTSEETGGVYFWGDVTGIQEKWGIDSFNNSTLPSNISGTSYDIALSKCEGGWRIPTETEWNELLTECSWESVSTETYSGYKIIGPSGNSIYLPNGLGGSANSGEWLPYEKIYWTSESDTESESVKAICLPLIESTDSNPISNYPLSSKANIRPVRARE